MITTPTVRITPEINFGLVSQVVPYYIFTERKKKDKNIIAV